MNRRKHFFPIIERRTLFWAALSLVLMLVSLYVYFIGSSIVNVLVRKEINQEIAATNSRISDLESQYLAQQNAINLAYARSLGFEDIENKQFVSSEQVLGKGLSVRDEI